MVNTGCPPTISIGPGPEYPTGGSDVFVLKLDPALTSAQYLTYLGGICDDSATSIVLEPSGNVWVGGFSSMGFPLVTPYELNGTGYYFVSELSADFSQLLFSSYSDGPNLAGDPTGNIYVAGSSQYSAGIEKNSGYGSGTTASLVKINPAANPTVIVDSIGPQTNAVAVPFFYSSTIAPGELITITGQNLGPTTTVMAQLDPTNHLPFTVGATSVSFGDYSAPLISVQAGLIVCFAPFEISGTTQVTVNVDGQSSNSVLVAVQPTAAYFLSAINQDGTVNSAAHPAPQGSVVTFYLTGLGLTSPLSQDGSVNAPPLPVPASSVSVDIGGNQGQVQFAAAADGLIAGITQINVQIPVATYPSNPVYVVIGGAEGQIYVAQ
jgi:uncharacterized protein (TIGR03437 family)